MTLSAIFSLCSHRFLIAMVKLIEKDAGNLQLFHAVLPAFIDALPQLPSTAPTASRKQEALKHVNGITTLRFEILGMQQVLTETHAEYDLIDGEIAEASEALVDVLDFLNDLVVMNPNVPSVRTFQHGFSTSYLAILRIENHCVHVFRINNTQDKSTGFPRLNALKDQILGYDSTHALESFSHCPHATLMMISYGEEADHYRKTIRSAKVFNRTMRSIYRSIMTETESEMPQIFQQQDQLEDDSSDRMALAEIQKARVIQDTAKVLVELLTENHEPYQAAHSALIHLNGFDQPEIDMVVSLCIKNGTNKASKKWHQVYWTSKIPPNASIEPQLPNEDICSKLRREQRSRRPLRVYVQTDGSWKCAAGPTKDRLMGNVNPPDLTLEKLLSTRQDHLKIKFLRKDRLELAVAIVQSLLHLSGSPLLKDQWNAENIRIAQTAPEGVGEGLRTQPYIFRNLGDNPLDGQWGDSSNTSRFVLDLGVLLCQLLFGRKVEVQEDDKADEDEDDPSLSLFNALNREYGDSQEWFVEKPCLDIISNCLDLYSSYQLDDRTLREKMYWNIVMPLKSCLKACYQSKESPAPLVSNRPRQTSSVLTSFVKSEVDLNGPLGISNQLQGPLRNRSRYNVSIGSRRIASPLPPLAESNLLAFSSSVR